MWTTARKLMGNQVIAGRTWPEGDGRARERLARYHEVRSARASRDHVIAGCRFAAWATVWQSGQVSEPVSLIKIGIIRS